MERNDEPREIANTRKQGTKRMVNKITVPLLEAAACGERTASEALFDFVYDRVKSTLKTGPGIDDAAQEAAMSILIAVREQSGGYDPAIFDKSSWVAIIAIRKALDQRRRVKPTREEDTDGGTADPSASDPLYEINLCGDKARLKELIEELSPEQRGVLVAHYHDDLSTSEIALALGVPVNTVKSRIFRALRTLRAGFNESVVQRARRKLSSKVGGGGT